MTSASLGLSAWVREKIEKILSSIFKWGWIDQRYDSMPKIKDISVLQNIGPFKTGDRISKIVTDIGKDGKISFIAHVISEDAGFNRLSESNVVSNDYIIINLTNDIPLHFFSVMSNQKL